MDFPDVTDRAVPDQLASLADEIAGVTLIAHHGGHAGFLRDTRDLPRYRTDEHKPLVDRWMKTVGKLPD